MKHNHTKEERLLDFSAGMNRREGINNADITLSVWVFTVNHLLRRMGSESHLPKPLSQQTLQTQARTRPGNTVYELSMGSVVFLEYYFLVAILLRVISSFTLNLLLFCEISELWGVNACILLLYDWGGRTASWELKLPTRRISALKALNSRALSPIAKQKHKSSKPCNIHPCREMNNIPLILYKGERRSNRSCLLVLLGFFFALVEHQSGAENWITDFWIPWSHDSSAELPESLCPSHWIFFSLSPLISLRQFLHCNLTTGSCSLAVSAPLAILYPNIMVTSRDCGVLGNHAKPFQYYEGSSLAFSALWQKK